MHSPYDPDEPEAAEEPDAGPYERLFELFDWENREAVYRVRFAQGDEYELYSLTAAQDIAEPPHGTALVRRTLRRAVGPWPMTSAMLFRLGDVAEVADADTGEILYRAV